jgi:hypothetical protein
MTDETTSNKKFLRMFRGTILVSRVSMVSELIKLKASIPFLHANSNALYDFLYLAAFSAGSVHLKKPSRWPKA